MPLIPPHTDILLDDQAKVTILDHIGRGDVCDHYTCRYTQGKSEGKGGPKSRWDRLIGSIGDEDTRWGLLKVAQSLSLVDLVQREWEALHKIRPMGVDEVRFYRYFPGLLTRLTIDGLPAIVLSYYEDYVSFQDILEAYPDGIDYRDLAWMLHRLLAGVGYAHRKGVIHGAIIPPHVLVHPVDHGAKILDWSYSVFEGSKQSISAYPTRWGHFLPPEVPLRQFPTPATDIYFVARCALTLLGVSSEGDWPSSVPQEVRDFLLPCLDARPSNRPQSAWDLLHEWSGVLHDLVGERVYRPFILPTRTNS